MVQQTLLVSSWHDSEDFGGAAIPAAIGGLAEALSVLTPLPNLTQLGHREA